MYNKKAQGWVKHLDFIVIDLIAFNIAYFLAYYFIFSNMHVFDSILYREILVVSNFICILVAVAFESFSNVLKRGYYLEFKESLKHTLIVILMMNLAIYLYDTSHLFPPVMIFSTFSFYTAITYITRILWKLIVNRFMTKSQKAVMAIVTTQDHVERLLNTFEKHNKIYDIACICIVDAYINQGTLNGFKVVSYEDLDEYICRQWIDEVFIDASVPYEESYSLSEKMNEMGVVTHRKLAKESELVGRKQFVEKVNGYTVLTSSINYAKTRQLILKRLIDICGGLVGCFITLILCLILGPMIKKQSPGPLFFKQQRVGQNGRKFNLYKFRSMYMDAEKRKADLMAQNKMNGLMFKMDDDPRIIGSSFDENGKYKKGIGNFIRDYSLDEFPQFLNVLKGDMSLVGTRPPTVDEWNKYELHHRARLAIKPGITGMWQVSGRSNITDFEEVVKLDKEYINNWNFGLDIKILLKTVVAVIKKEGSV